MPLPHPLTTYSSYNFQIAVFNIDSYIPFPMVTSGVAAGEIRDGAEIWENAVLCGNRMYGDAI